MENLFRRIGIRFCTTIFIVVLLVALGMEKVISKEFKIPLYIIKEQNKYEVFLISEYLEGYEIGEIKLIDKKNDKEIGLKNINNRKFLSQELVDGNEYVFEINIKNKTTNQRDVYTQKFKYVSNNLNVQNDNLNSCDITVDYDRKNLIFMYGIDIYGKLANSNQDEFDFIYKRHSIDLENNYKNKLRINDVCLKPGSSYNIYSISRLDNDINLVSMKNIKTKPFNITSLRSKMTSDKKLKIQWEVSNSDLKFLKDDSIKIYVKKASDLNYSSIPNVKIVDVNTFSAEVDAGEVSSNYEIKLVYDLCGKTIEKIINQENDFYKLYSKVSLSNLRNLNLTFGFDNKFKFKDGEILNIYLVDEDNDSLEPKKIFSERIDSISFNPNHKFVFNNLKLNNNYKILYEILYKDGKTLKLKEDKFETKNFELKKFDVYTSSDKQKNLKLNMKWEFINHKFKFFPGDSVSIYIKNKEDSNYSEKPYFYADTNLNQVKSLTIDMANDVKGGYDVKLVYLINGKEYTTFNEFYIKKDSVKTFSMRENKGDSSQEEPFVKFNSTVKEQKFNRAVVDIKIEESVKFENGDLLQLYIKSKESKNSGYKLYCQYEHTSDAITEPNIPEEDVSKEDGGGSGSSSSGGSSVPEIVSKKVDLKTITSIDIDYLVPNKEYDVKVVLRTKNDMFGDAITLPIPVQPGDGNESVPGGGEGEDNQEGDTAGGSNGENSDGVTDGTEGGTGGENSGDGNGETEGEGQEGDKPEEGEGGTNNGNGQGGSGEAGSSGTDGEGTEDGGEVGGTGTGGGSGSGSGSSGVTGDQGQGGNNGNVGEGGADSGDGSTGDSSSDSQGSQTSETQQPQKTRDGSVEEDKYNTSVMPEYLEYGVVDDKFVVAKTLNFKTAEFQITKFEPETIKPNSATFTWEINDSSTEFDEKDKVEIYVKRKVTNGYPAGNSFIKTGSEMSNVFSGEAIVRYMKMDYTAKLVYTISGVKFEKEVDFKTISAETSANITDITEHCAKLHLTYPKDYIFTDGDVLEIYFKEQQESKYPEFPVMFIAHVEGSNNLQDLTTFNFIDLKPQMVYDVLVRIKNRANDIPDYITQFMTKAITLKNCRIESMMGDNLRIKTDMENNPEILDYVQLYLDIFYKEKGQTKYSSKPLLSAFRENTLDCEITLPDKFKEYDFLLSFNPHGFFNDTLFIEFELDYKTIRPTIEITDVEDEQSIKKVYTLSWMYPPEVTLLDEDKLNIYLKELPYTPPESESEKPEEVTKSSSEDNSENNDNSGNTNNTGNEDAVLIPSTEYKKIYTIESVANLNAPVNIESFLSDNKKYEILIEVESKNFKVGPGRMEFIVDKLVTEKTNDSNGEEIFEVPIKVEDFKGVGDTLTYSLPDLGDVTVTNDMGVSCDIENISCEVIDGEISIKGLVPCKTYENIEIKIQVEDGKEITFTLENIKLEPEEKSQEFLYNVYNRSFLRDPDEGGYQYWMGRLKTKDISAREFVDNLLFAEKEFSEMEYTTDELITVLYSIIVNRDPDSEGLKFWIDLYNNEIIINAGGDAFKAKRHIVDRMINEKEFENLIVGMDLKY